MCNVQYLTKLSDKLYNIHYYNNEINFIYKVAVNYSFTPISHPIMKNYLDWKQINSQPKKLQLK